MKKIAFALLAVLAFVACNNEKEYVINGSFNIPEQLQFGDTVIERGPLNGIQVFLFDMKGDPVDSVIVENETFTFRGKVKADQPWYGTLLCDYCMGLLVIEPGAINVVLTDDVEATGTPLNDGVTEIVETTTALEEYYYEKMYSVYESFVVDGNVTSEEELHKMLMPIYYESAERRNAVLDSFYVENKDNLVGVFAASALTEGASTSAELESMLTEYSEYVQQSEWVQTRLDMMRKMEAEDDHSRFLDDFGDLLDTVQPATEE